MSKYLLTSIAGVPCVISCPTEGALEAFKARGSVTMSASTWKKNKKDWTQEVSAEKIALAEKVNAKLASSGVNEYEVWIRKEDAG